MKSDLPRLMHERNLDALVIIGPDGLSAANTAFTYFTGATHVTNGTIVVKQSDSAPYLIHSTMERDEAAKTGMQLINIANYKMPEIVKQVNGDRLAARVEFTRRLFEDLGVSGRVGFYGLDSVGAAFSFLDALSREEFVEVITEYDNDILSDVIGTTRDFLRRHRVVDETLVKQDGTPLTVGDVKAFIRREEAAVGLEDPGFIFAIGRDAGVPHSSGTATDVIRLGQTIVFDIFPRLPGSYHADITRTWCLDYAPEEVQAAYELVMHVHDTLAQAFDTQRFTYEFQDMACDLFEAHGHKTLRQDLSLTNGYIHVLGHSFGLAVHEAPTMGMRGVRPDERMQIGTVITNEPGLYYPDRGWGVRVEDDYWCNPEDKFECLTDVDRSLVVPM
jgi:Xaa-Pro aminopeptidase